MGDPKHRNAGDPVVDLAQLRARIRKIERVHADGVDGGAAEGEGRHRTLSLGVGPVDAALPGGGLALGRVHEIVGEGRSEVRDAACFGFTMALLARQRASSAGAVGSNQTGSNQAGSNQTGRDQILWCPAPGNRSGGRIHGRGLAAYGLDPDKIIWVDARDRADRLWAMEQALACPGLLAAVIELEAGPGGRSQERRDVVERRLQLAAEAGGVLGLVLRPMADAGSGLGGGIADTRWKVRSAASDDWQPTWHVALRRVRGGVGGDWLLRWDAAARNFHAYVCEKPNAGTAFGTDFRQSRALV